MNSKAIKKQLLAAVAMVLVAAVALGSSTYAWFVASGTVEAYGMKVQAQSEGGLAISFNGGAWGTSATAEVDPAVRLYPASTYNMSAWSHATAKAVDDPAAVPESRENITATVMDGSKAKDNNGYVLMKEFQIRSTSKDATKLSSGLYVSDVVVTATKTMSTALRVGVRYIGTSSTPAYIFGPVSVPSETPGDPANTATQTYRFYSSDTDTAGTEVKLNTTGKGNADLLDAGSKISNDPNSAITVQIFIWFEGEDGNLYSDNYKAEDLNVSVKFSSMSDAGV